MYSREREREEGGDGDDDDNGRGEEEKDLFENQYFLRDLTSIMMIKKIQYLISSNNYFQPKNINELKSFLF